MEMTLVKSLHSGDPDVIQTRGLESAWYEGASPASDIPVKADKKPIKTYIRACAPDVTPTCTEAAI